jgi:hypothetical protein
MSKLNVRHTPVQVTSPVHTERTPSYYTFEGAPGYARDTRGELFTLGVSLMAGESTFYESADARNTRFVELVNVCTQDYPVWTADFLCWLRNEANIRTAAIMGAATFVKAWGELECGQANNCQNPVNYWSSSGDGYSCAAHKPFAFVPVRPRAVVDSVLVRGDEPGEIISYWLATYGKALPMPLKRGVSDALRRLGSERNYLKWDSPERGVRWADALNLCHPKPKAPWQDDLFGYAVAAPHEDGLAPAETLAMLTARRELMALPVGARRGQLANPAVLAEAGITWEALAGWLQGPMTAEAWEAVIPSMGYMALIRNLRNFDAAGVSDDVCERVAQRLADPAEVAKSRQFPYRFYSAYAAVASDRWGSCLGHALEHSVHNIPALPGRTAIYIDTSGSMQSGLSDKSQMSRAQAAALFAVALAYRCGVGNVDLYGYASGVFGHSLPRGGSVLRQCERFVRRIGEVGMGTNTWQAVAATYAAQDRIFVFTDEQCTAPLDVARAPVPTYTFNLGGYRYAHAPSGQANWHTLAGLTDGTFSMVPILESRRNGAWPWEIDTAAEQG